MSSKRELATVMATHRDDMATKAVLTLIESLVIRDTEQLTRHEDPKEMYRSQGRIYALTELRRLITGI